MATLNLGRIKPVFQGAYNNSTAYVVDDIVTFGDETFICIQASTGNATSNASYWTKMAAKGTNGTNGTDVGTVITTQGDILYRDGSGLQRLPKGTASQVLAINSGATAPEWVEPAGGMWKKLSTQTLGSDVGTVEFTNTYLTNAYTDFCVVISNLETASETNLRTRVRKVGDSSFTTGNYEYGIRAFKSDGTTDSGSSNSNDMFLVTPNNLRAEVAKPANIRITYYNMFDTNSYVGFESAGSYMNSSDQTCVLYGSGMLKDGAGDAWDRILLYTGSGNIKTGTKFELYGRA